VNEREVRRLFLEIAPGSFKEFAKVHAHEDSFIAEYR